MNVFEKKNTFIHTHAFFQNEYNQMTTNKKPTHKYNLQQQNYTMKRTKKKF